MCCGGPVRSVNLKQRPEGFCFVDPVIIRRPHPSRGPGSNGALPIVDVEGSSQPAASGAGKTLIVHACNMLDKLWRRQAGRHIDDECGTNEFGNNEAHDLHPFARWQKRRKYNLRILKRPHHHRKRGCRGPSPRLFTPSARSLHFTV